MNNFQGIESGAGLLKNDYGDSKNNRSALSEALKRKREKAYYNKQDPDEKIDLLEEKKNEP